MSVLTLVIVSLGAAALVLALRSRSTLAWALALVGLAAVAVVAIGLTPGTVGAGTSTLQTTGSDRSLLAAVGVGALLLGFVGAASSAPPTVAAGLSVGMAGVALAIATDDPLVGFWALTAAGLAVLGVASLDRARASAWASRALALRLTGGAGVVAVAGVSFAAPPLASPAHDPGILGLAYLGVAAAVAARLAAVPLHRWAARLADAASVPLLAPMLVWLPVAIGLVATSWLVGPLGSAGADLASERMLVALVGLGTMTLAALAALAQDDLGHATAYLAIADAGLILVACGVDGPVVVPPLRTALLALLASKTGLVAWLVATESAYGTRRLPDLGGWARRSPLLGLAFSVVAIATVGWPGSPMLDARLDVVRFATGSAAPIAAIALFAALPAYARTLWIGLGRPLGAVAAAETSRLRRPAAWAVGDGGRARERLGALARDLTAVWSLDRRPVAAAAVLLLALLGVAITAGAWPTPA